MKLAIPRSSELNSTKLIRSALVITPKSSEFIKTLKYSHCCYCINSTITCDNIQHCILSSFHSQHVVVWLDVVNKNQSLVECVAYMGHKNSSNNLSI